MKRLLLVALVSAPRLAAFLVGLFGVFMLYATLQDASTLAEVHQRAHERFPEQIPPSSFWKEVIQVPVLLTLVIYLALGFLGLFGAFHKQVSGRRRAVAGILAGLIILAAVLLNAEGARFELRDLGILVAFAVLAALPVFLPHPFTMWQQHRPERILR